jgi:hypothetical protein
MALFLDLRYQNDGGGLSSAPVFFEGTQLFLPGTQQPGDYKTVPRDVALNRIFGKNVLIATHGFNVNRANGIDCLNTWGSLLQLTAQDAFLGLLWPGDSAWAHGLDYFDEPKIADEAGKMLGPFLDDLLAGAASVSFASHSLGARVILRTVQQMKARQPRAVILMAGAIDDDCLTNEFQQAAATVGRISVLASMKDPVLEWLFPAANPLSGIIDSGHPWWRGALGRSGPRQPWPSNFLAPYEIPENWAYVHGDYLQVAPASSAPILAPVYLPASTNYQIPLSGAPGWQQTWSSAFASTRFKG